MGCKSHKSMENTTFVTFRFCLWLVKGQYQTNKKAMHGTFRFLANQLEEKVKDKRGLQLIRKYLQSGIMEGGLVKPTEEEGAPQGSFH